MEGTHQLKSSPDSYSQDSPGPQPPSAGSRSPTFYRDHLTIKTRCLEQWGMRHACSPCLPSPQNWVLRLEALTWAPAAHI